MEDIFLGLDNNSKYAIISTKRPVYIFNKNKSLKIRIFSESEFFLTDEYGIDGWSIDKEYIEEKNKTIEKGFVFLSPVLEFYIYEFLSNINSINNNSKYFKEWLRKKYFAIAEIKNVKKEDLVYLKMANKIIEINFLKLKSLQNIISIYKYSILLYFIIHKEEDKMLKKIENKIIELFNYIEDCNFLGDKNSLIKCIVNSFTSRKDLQRSIINILVKKNILNKNDIYQ